MGIDRVCIWIQIIINCARVLAVLEDLVLMPVHTKPEDSVKELDELYDVFQDVKKKWKTDVKHNAHLYDTQYTYILSNETLEAVHYCFYKMVTQHNTKFIIYI